MQIQFNITTSPKDKKFIEWLLNKEREQYREAIMNMEGGEK